MAKNIRHNIEYYSLSIFASLIRRLSLRQARRVACLLADFVYYFVPIRKKVVIQNISESFKEKTLKEIKSIARKTYRQFSQTMMELLFMPKINAEQLKDLVGIENKTLLDKTIKDGKGAILVGAHFGNWELMGAALAQYYPVSFVIGQQQNIKVDGLLNSYRLSKGISLIPLKMALRGVMSALKANKFVAILSDQDAHETGAFVEYFGRPASTPKGPALFALRSGCPLIMGTAFRDNGKFRAMFELVPKPEPSGDEEKDIINYTAAYTKILEAHTRSHPDHWFWMHRRWKTKQKCIKN